MPSRIVAVASAVVAALAWGATPPPARAAGPLRLTLAEAVDEALEANPGLKVLSHRSVAAERSAEAVSRERWGQVDAFFNYSRTNDAWVVRPMSEEILGDAGGFGALPWDRNQQHYGVSFHLPLYLGGRLSNGAELARLETQGAAALLEGTRWQVRFNAVSLYTAAQTLDAVVAGFDELVASLEKNRERLELMVRLGKRPELDRLKVVEQLEDAKAQREAVRADRARVGAMLLALLGRDPSRRIEVEPLEDRVPELDTARQDLAARLDRTSRVRQARIAAEQSRRNVALATSSFLPSVVAEGNYTRNDAPSVNDPLDTWQVIVSVKVPLFHGGSRFAALEAARARERAAEYGIEQARLAVASDLQDALARFRSVRAELAAARARVAAAAEAARIEQIRYDTGAGTVEDLLRAQARRASARASLAKALGAVVTAAERINSIVEEDVVR
ncbi:MAG: TolC family protein [Deltaproteobacteria bacterium]|nr:TolC family protein [Deltaproteobacteria bacterium]